VRISIPQETWRYLSLCAIEIRIRSLGFLSGLSLQCCLDEIPALPEGIEAAKADHAPIRTKAEQPECASYQRKQERRTQSLLMQYGHLFSWPGVPNFIDFSKVTDVAVLRARRRSSQDNMLWKSEECSSA
jgi:hypothetical protein